MGSKCKKKVFTELTRYCPVYFASSDSYEFYVKVKAKVITLATQMQHEIAGEEVPERLAANLDELERYFVEQSNPANFDEDSPENDIYKMLSNFEALCSVLESNGVSNAANLTTLQFYSRLEFFKKQHQPRQPK